MTRKNGILPVQPSGFSEANFLLMVVSESELSLMHLALGLMHLALGAFRLLGPDFEHLTSTQTRP